VVSASNGGQIQVRMLRITFHNIDGIYRLIQRSMLVSTMDAHNTNIVKHGRRYLVHCLYTGGHPFSMW